MLGAEPNAHTQGVKGAGSLLPATFLFPPTPSVLRTHELMTFCSLPQTTGEMPGQAGYLWLPGCQVQGGEGGGWRERERGRERRLRPHQREWCFQPLGSLCLLLGPSPVPFPTARKGRGRGRALGHLFPHGSPWWGVRVGAILGPVILGGLNIRAQTIVCCTWKRAVVT